MAEATGEQFSVGFWNELMGRDLPAAPLQPVQPLLIENGKPVELVVDAASEYGTRRAVLPAMGTLDQYTADWESNTDAHRTALAQRVFKMAGM